MRYCFAFGADENDQPSEDFLQSVISSLKLNLPLAELVPITIPDALKTETIHSVRERLRPSGAGDAGAKLICLDWVSLMACAGLTEKHLWSIHEPFLGLRQAIGSKQLSREQAGLSDDRLLLGLWMAIANCARIATPDHGVRSGFRKRFSRWIDFIPLPALLPIVPSADRDLFVSVVMTSASTERCRQYTDDIVEISRLCKAAHTRLYVFASDEVGRHLQEDPAVTPLINGALIIETPSTPVPKALQCAIHIHVGPFDRLGIFRPEDSWHNGKLVIQYDKITKARSADHLRHGSNGMFFSDAETMMQFLVSCHGKPDLARGLSTSGHRAYIEAALTWPDIVERVAK